MKDSEQITRLVKLSNVKAEKRIVYGIVYEPMKADSHKEFMKAESIELMAHRFMANSREIDEQHDWSKDMGIPVESFIVRDGDKEFVNKDGSSKVGAWVLGVKVIDDGVWKKIKNKEIKAFSLAGFGQYGKEKLVESDWFDEEGNYTNPYDEED